MTEYAHDSESICAAAERAISEGYTLGKYADPPEGARVMLTADEAAEVAQQDWDAMLTTVSRSTRKLAQQVMLRHAGHATGRSCTARLARRGWIISYEQGDRGVFIGVYGGRRFAVSARSAAVQS